MKQLFLAIVSLTIITLVSTVEYKDELFYDYEEPEVRSEKISEESETSADDKPTYKLKDAPRLFTEFIKDYNKKYIDEADFYKHYKNFVANLEEIIRINKENKDSRTINTYLEIKNGVRKMVIAYICCK
ncbi:unnamed protein product [Parnassius apollo]|uniref:(apollo) hypothetical protein n=1 Tax=Parnassius apollo TaxID=110799 RepID=A0A8S3Y0P2_PARAO|nr:unnamed protein product [Parnassius apollo]